jgi:NADH/F420H2 dehydrogenase subunit C
LPELSAIRIQLRERFRDVSVEPGVDMEVATVPADQLLDVLQFLRDDFSFEMLTDITGVDWLGREPRYDVNYHLLSMSDLRRIRVKVQIPDGERLEAPSVTGLWAGANWQEREVFDFFGIVFTGHPNLTRILMPDEWVGHPQRKDYPVGGVPVEYRMEPAYVGENVVPPDARPAAGGVPVRLRQDRGRLSHWSWTGAPASGVRKREPIEGHGPSAEGDES